MIIILIYFIKKKKGEWSSTSTALNIIWLTWATQKDLQYTSNKKVTTKQAIEESSKEENGSSRKYGNSGYIFVLCSTLLTIIFNIS